MCLFGFSNTGENLWLFFISISFISRLSLYVSFVIYFYSVGAFSLSVSPIPVALVSYKELSRCVHPHTCVSKREQEHRSRWGTYMLGGERSLAPRDLERLHTHCRGRAPIQILNLWGGGGCSTKLTQVYGG